MSRESGERGGLDVVVIGAGISGLLAARRLATAGRRVRVYEKSRGPGGRMATRRFGDAVFDHGAQYLTARESVFSNCVEEWLREGLLTSWGDGFATAGGGRKTDGEQRYFGARGMTTVPKWLAESLDTQYGVTASSCAWVDGAWEVAFKERPPVRASALLLTAPVPQSLDLLRAGDSQLPAAAEDALRAIEYDPCLAALIRLTGPSQVPSPGGLWLDGEPVGWVADNTQKGISPPALGASVTIHAGPQFSRDHWGVDPDEIAARLAEVIHPWLGAEITATQVHRWRYSVPTTVYPERCLALWEPGRVVIAGDAFGGPRIEGAALSGLAAADALSEER